MTPTVSVLIPTYRRRGYLLEALESLVGQTYAGFEAIVGNDGGPGYIEPVKARFTDERIRWVDHRVRRGIPGPPGWSLCVRLRPEERQGLVLRWRPRFSPLTSAGGSSGRLG